MPDITMCVNNKCALRKICYRHKDSGTKPSSFQSQALFKNNTPQEGRPICDNFISTDGRGG